jgi:hypothetical protein
MDVTPESRYGDLVRQLNEFGNPAGARVLYRRMDPEDALRTIVEGVLALAADEGSLDAADRVLRHAVHIGVEAPSLVRCAFELGRRAEKEGSDG